MLTSTVSRLGRVQRCVGLECRPRHNESKKHTECFTGDLCHDCEREVGRMADARDQPKFCGNLPVDGVPGVENHDVSDLVRQHVDYVHSVPKILERIFAYWAS